jgi:DNA-binding transcriptional LysR family regulator
MDIRELRYFIAAYEERSVTAAARRCFVSQPSVSAAIASLEAELGATLFVRHKKGVSPTAAGERLHPIARRIAEQELAARSLFREPERARRITLGLMRTLDIQRTLEIIAPLVREPDLHVRLVAAEQECDARVVSRLMLADGEEFVPLWLERYVVALPPRHPLASRDVLRGAELVGARLIARCYCENSDIFARYNPRFDVVATAPSEEWALAMVAAGLGIAILPEGAVARNDVVVRTIADIDVTRQVGLAYTGRGASAEVQRLVARLESSAVRSRRRRSAARPRRSPRRTARS